MEIKRIEGANKFHGAPENWNEAEHGFCGTLPTVDIVSGNVPFMMSAWEPLPDEMARLNAGAHIFLGVSAPVHPVVFLGVGDAVSPAAPAAVHMTAVLQWLEERGLKVFDLSSPDAIPDALTALLAAWTDDVKADCIRYRWLRSRDLDAVTKGGIFAGRTPENVVLNLEDLDAAIDAEMSAVGGGAR